MAAQAFVPAVKQVSQPLPYTLKQTNDQGMDSLPINRYVSVMTVLQPRPECVGNHRADKKNSADKGANMNCIQTNGTLQNSIDDTLIPSLLLRNQRWANKISKIDPVYFSQLASGQTPACLWIGCIDSRVAPELITESHFGEMLVYRSPANTFSLENDDVKAMLDLAIHIIGVRSIIVCGHSHCGAIQQFLDHAELAKTNNFFARIGSLARKYEPVLKTSSDRANTLARLNVIDQVHRIEKENCVAHSPHGKIAVHGLFYNISTGCLEKAEKEVEWQSMIRSKV
jgi:carbonic anhydrase